MWSPKVGSIWTQQGDLDSRAGQFLVYDAAWKLG